MQARKKEKRMVRFYQLTILLLFFIGWEVLSRLGWIDPLLFSSPTKVWQTLHDKIVDGSLLLHVNVTLIETVIGFLAGTFIGTLLATLLWWSSLLSKVLDPYLVILNAMPKVALGPILIVALGPGYFSIIAMGALISIIITTIVVYTAFKGVDPNYSKVLQTFGATRWQVFREVILPASFPTIISTLKVNVGLSWVGVIVGEFLVASKGLGYLIIYGFQVFNFNLVLMSLLIIAFFATLMYQVVELVERRIVKQND
ncbi:ABC transporter permease [Lysinibacillus piscis]